MRPFAYHPTNDPAVAVHAAAGSGVPTDASAQFLAGGTTILDLMKLDVMRPATLVEINGLGAPYAAIKADAKGLRLGALARMAAVAADPAVARDYPVIAQSLLLAASAQLRNMASLGGNVLQRTRCSYFRDTRWTSCNKRNPGSGCAALDGVNRQHAILGTSDACIATYPGDFAVALVALDASVDVLGPGGARNLRFADLHRLPGDTPQIETVLAPGDLITGFTVPAGAYTRRSTYVKIRDRDSYQFALASAAVALDMAGGVVREARIGLGGVATKPWRAVEAEAALKGRPVDEATATEAARLAFGTAKSRGQNGYKLELGIRTVTRALLQASKMEA